MSDRATSKPEEHISLFCGVCDTKMNVVRGVNGPTGMAESMAGKKHLHDFFACPFIEEDWHVQAKMIQEAARKTPSKIIETILLGEAVDIIENRYATKKISVWSQL